MDLVNLQVNTFQKRCSSPEPWGFWTKCNRQNGGLSESGKMGFEKWNISPKMLKRSVESSAVHWLNTKEECRLMRTRGFVSSGGNLLRNVRQAGHMANKEGLLVHVRTHNPNGCQILLGTWSLICSEFVLGLACLCSCANNSVHGGYIRYSGTVL